MFSCQSNTFSFVKTSIQRFSIQIQFSISNFGSITAVFLPAKAELCYFWLFRLFWRRYIGCVGCFGGFQFVGWQRRVNEQKCSGSRNGVRNSKSRMQNQNFNSKFQKFSCNCHFSPNFEWCFPPGVRSAHWAREARAELRAKRLLSVRSVHCACLRSAQKLMTSAQNRPNRYMYVLWRNAWDDRKTKRQKDKKRKKIPVVVRFGWFYV